MRAAFVRDLSCFHPIPAKDPHSVIHVPTRICLRALATAMTLVMATLVAGCAWLSPAQAVARTDRSAPYEALFFKAQLSHDQGSYDEAIETLQPLQSEADVPPEVLVLLAESYSGQRDLDRSLEVLADAIERYPSYVPARELRASVYRRRGMKSEAIDDLEAALRIVPNNARLIESLASLRLRSLESWELGSEGSDMRRTIELYEHLARLRSGSDRITPLIVLASIYSRMGDHDAAIDYARQATSIRSHDLRAQLTLASIYEEAGQLDKALATYRQALLIEPSNNVIQNKIAEMLMETGAEGGTLAFYRDLAGEFPGVRQIQEVYAGELIKAARWEEAIGFYQALIERYGESRELRAGLVQALLAADREEEAMDMVENVFLDDATDTQTLLDLAEALRKRDKADFVIGLLRSVRESGNSDVRLGLALAQVQIQAGNEGDAVQTLESVVEGSPSLFPVVALLADLYADEGRFEEARELLAGVDKTTRERRGVEIRLREANLYRMEGRLPEAADILEKVIDESDPPAEPVLKLLVEIYSELGETEKALAVVDRYVAATSDDANRGARGLKAWLHWRNKDYAAAAEILEELHAEDENDFATLQLLVENYAEMGEFDKAEGLMRAAGTQAGGELDADFLMLRARLYHLQDKHDEAAQTAEKLLAREEDNDNYLMIAGEYYYEAGRIEDAERVLRRAIELDPKNAEAYNALGYFFAEAGVKLEEALDLVNRALELNPDAGHIVDSLGWVHYMQGRYEEAARELERAVKLLENSPDAVIYEHLGDAYSKLGRVEDAREAYRKALELDPGSEKIRNKLE